MGSKNKMEKIRCSKCSVETNHIRAWKSETKKAQSGGVWEEVYYELLQCAGCETPTLKRHYLCSENDMVPALDENGVIQKSENGLEVWELVPQITLWPKRGVYTKPKQDYYEIPPKVNRIYSETIDAFNDGLILLCAIGIRAIIEAVCNEEQIQGNDLKDKIEKLKDKGVITKKLSDALQENRVLGNQSAHEMKLVSENTLSFAIQLVESMLDFHYNSDTRAYLIKSNLEKGDTSNEDF